MPKMKNENKSTSAFTIVELLIVIVIISILAAITIVSYRGITQKAGEASLQSDLSNASKKIKLYQADHGLYPADFDANNCPKDASGVVDNNYCLKSSNGNKIDYLALEPYSAFSLTATKDSIVYRTTDKTAPSSVSTASTFANVWGGSNDEFGSGLTQTSDGGYIVTGRTASFNGGNLNMYIAKYDTGGNLTWNRSWGGASIEHGYSIIQTSDGGYAVTGYTMSYGAGDSDIFLAKFDGSGNLNWSRTWGGTNAEIGTGLVQTSDGGYAITGYTKSYGAGNNDVIALKYDSTGAFSWSKSWGGTSNETGESIVQTSDGGLAIAGETYGYGAGGADVFLIKLTSAGILSWNKVWGGTSNEIDRKLVQTSDGGFAIAGYSASYGTGGDIFLTKCDSSGNISWNKTWGGTNGEYGYGLVQSSDGGYVVAGLTMSFGAGSYDAALIKFDSSGNLAWNKTWGGASIENGHNLALTGDGGYIMSGDTSSFGAGNQDMFLLKFNSSGVINNCSSPMCQSPSATITSPSPTVNTPVVTLNTPSSTMTSPAVTTSIPPAATAVIAAP